MLGTPLDGNVRDRRSTGLAESASSQVESRQDLGRGNPGLVQGRSEGKYIFGCGNRNPKETRDLDQVRERPTAMNHNIIHSRP